MRVHPLSAPLDTLYGTSLSLLTDLYQLTMAYGYWKQGMAEREAVFHLNFRKNPFEGGYALTCGLESVLAYLERFHFSTEDLDYLAGLKGNDDNPLFEGGFLEYLRTLRFTGSVDAVLDGSVMLPHEPLLRVTGSLLQGQLVETPLLNLINFQTLIATKASRVAWAADGDTLLEFGLRRAQGIDGSLSASLAAYVGGFQATSNVLAGRLFGIPVRGTHAHAWVMAFESELEAFEKYAEALPNNCIFLVDTYNTLEGVRHAVQVGEKLRVRGYKLAGIRLDSGDLAYLSIEARKILDQHGFTETAIVASNDLDEHLIANLKQQGARINVWGVGTQLVTAYDQPALGGVYKLTALRKPDQSWAYRIKLSEQAIKISNPGILQVRRFYEAGQALADAIYDQEQPPAGDWTVVDPLDMTRRKVLHAGLEWEDLLVPVMRKGHRVAPPVPVQQTRSRAQQQLALFHAGIKRLTNPHQFPVGLEKTLFDLKTKLIFQARGIPE